MSDDLQQAAREARETVVQRVEASPGLHVNVLYKQLTQKKPRWPEPAVRTAIWDLIAERQLVIRRGNKLYPATR